MKVLSAEEVSLALQTRAPWILEDGMLVLTMRLQSFDDVSRLVSGVLRIAKDLDHHPDVCFGYNSLRICTVTHDADGINEKDIACADQILKLLAS